MGDPGNPDQCSPMDGRRVEFALGSIFSTALKLTAKTRPLRCYPRLLDAHNTLPSSPNTTNLILFVHWCVLIMSALAVWLPPPRLLGSRPSLDFRLSVPLKCQSAVNRTSRFFCQTLSDQSWLTSKVSVCEGRDPKRSEKFLAQTGPRRIPNPNRPRHR